MTVIRAEFSFEDYIIEEWCAELGIGIDEFEDHVYDFVDDYFSTTPDDAYVI